MTQMYTEVWAYRDTTLGTDLSAANLVGYDVEATDGSIGKVDEATFDATAGHIVVDTGPWIFGKKVILPAGVISSADHNEETVFVNRTKDQIKNAPEFDDSLAYETRPTADSSVRTTAAGALAGAIGTDDHSQPRTHTPSASTGPPSGPRPCAPVVGVTSRRGGYGSKKHRRRRTWDRRSTNT